MTRSPRSAAVRSSGTPGSRPATRSCIAKSSPHRGRPPATTPHQTQPARPLLAQPEHTVSSIAKLLGVSRSTIYKHVPELTKQPPAPPSSASADVAVNNCRHPTQKPRQDEPD